MIKILVVDDQRTAREILKAQLSSEPDFEVVGVASDGQMAIEQVEILQPDIVLIDMEMPGLDGVGSTEIICRQFPAIKVIVLSMYQDDEYVTRSIQAGAMGYLLKNTPGKELIEAIRFVEKGYSQIGPGLMTKLVSAMPISNQVERSSMFASNSTDLDSDLVLNDSQKQSLSQLISLPKQKRPWWHYGMFWLLGNLVIWGSSLLYLQIASPRYTSSWKIALPGASSSTSINIPEIGQASSNRDSPYNSLIADPRENYRLLAMADDVLIPAAQSLNMTAKEFGKPEVQIVDNTTLMEFAIEGDSPELAKSKALALHQALKSRLYQLRQAETSQPDDNLAETLKNAEAKLAEARRQLTEYQTSSGLNSSLKLKDLSGNIEQLQLEKAQLNTRQKQAKSQFEQLLNQIGLSVNQAQDAISLESDRVFQQYLDNYSQLSTELVNLQGKFSQSHPAVIAKQEDQQETATALSNRASSVLGRSMNMASLNRLGLDNNEGQKAVLLERLIALDTEKEGLEAQKTALAQQIAESETRLRNLFESGATVERLRKNLQIAEAVYSSTWTEAEISRSKTSSIYPSISLLTAPELPDSPSSPKPKLVIFGATLASLFLTTALLSLWNRDLALESFLNVERNSNNHNHKFANNSHNNIDAVIKK